jgi:four helix bundle protein
LKEIAMEFKFEKLIIWQKAMDPGEEIHSFSKSFPKDELYNLASQIKRAADSVALDISEGSAGQTNPEFKRFMTMAIRSLAEVVTCIHKAKRRKYISDSDFLKHYEFAFNLMNMMIACRNNIK